MKTDKEKLTQMLLLDMQRWSVPALKEALLNHKQMLFLLLVFNILFWVAVGYLCYWLVRW